MTSPTGTHFKRLSLTGAGHGPAAMRAACLAGTAAILLAVALPAPAQQTPSTEPEALPAPAAGGTGDAGSPSVGVTLGDAAAEPPASQEATGAGTASLDTAAESIAETAEPVPFDGQIVAQDAGSFALSDLLGAEVKGSDGEPIGTVHDVLFTDQNRIGGIVVAVGGFLGFGEKPVGIDIERARMVKTTRGERSVILESNLAEIERAPAFVSLEEQQRAAEDRASKRAADERLREPTREPAIPEATQ